MNYKIFTLFIAAILITSVANAKIFRVGYTALYNATPLTGVDYTSMADADGAAGPGDTIQVYGSVTGGNMTKRLVIIGFGYNLDAHPGLQTNANNVDAPSFSGGIFFGPGTDGSVIIGMTSDNIYGFQCGDYYQTGTPVSNITFERCYGSFYLYNRGEALSNVRIINCVCLNIIMQDGDNGIPVNNLQVYNCILDYITLYNNATTASVINCVSAPNTYGHINLNTAQVLLKNSVIYPVSSSNTIFQNNFIYGSAYPLPAGSSNNYWDVGFDDIFNELGVPSSYSVGTPGFTVFNENWYILKVGSPAINAGTNADNSTTDCGIFGGEPAYIYKIGGIPSVPSIYQLTAPGSEASSNPYKITISVRSNN